MRYWQFGVGAVRRRVVGGEGWPGPCEREGTVGSNSQCAHHGSGWEWVHHSSLVPDEPYHDEGGES
jgi:hypothetical protein